MKTTRRTTEQVIRILPDQMLKSKVLELALEKNLLAWSGGRGCLWDCRRRQSGATTSGPSSLTTPSEGTSCGRSI